MLRDKDLRQVAVYFGLAYGFSAAFWSLLQVQRFSQYSSWLFSLGTFGPTIAALATHRIFTGNWKAVRLWAGLVNLLLGILAGAGPFFLAAFSTAFFMTQSGIERWQWAALLQIPLFLGPNLLGGPLGEEAGWRGYALPRLQRRFGPLTASLVLGFIWANWHIPLLLAHVYNLRWWQFVAMIMAFSVYLSFAFNKSKGSTVCAILVHGTLNVGTGIILNDLIAKATLRSNDAQHNILAITYAAVAGLLCIATKGRLGYEPEQQSAVELQTCDNQEL